jgi:large subunit ribosomal protein L25
MSAPVSIKADKREALGSRANDRLRKTGLVPAVIYGHKQDVLPLQINKKELVTHINHGTHVFNLDIAGATESALLKEVQYDAFGQEVLHVDFARVDLNERVTVSVSIELKGDPKGEKEGGVLQQILNELEIECVVTEIPDVINVDVSNLGKASRS